MNDQAKEYREMETRSLVSKLEQLRSDLAEARENVRNGKEKNNAVLRGLRRQVARVATIIQKGTKLYD